MTREQAIKYRLQGVLVVVVLGAAGVCFWVGAGPLQQKHHPDYGSAEIFGVLGFITLGLALGILFDKPTTKDRA